MTTVDRWTGRETRQLRLALRLTVRAFAEDLGVSPRTISKWESGGVDHEPRPELQAALDTMLCRASSDERERFGGSATRTEEVEANPGDAELLGIGDTWERDGTRILADFLASSEQLTPDVAVRLTHEWRVVQPPQVIELRAGRRVGARLADVVQERVDVLRRMDDFVGGGDLHDLVRSELRATVDIVHDAAYTEDVGRTLLAAVGEMCQLAGWVASDAGLHGLAERYYLGGVTAAHAAQDPASAANLLSSLSYQVANVGSPQKAVLLASSALSGLDAKASASTRALLLERVAWANARLGGGQTAERTLAEVERIFARQNTDDDPSWTYWLNQTEIDLMAGRCLTELKHPAPAIRLLSRAIDEYDDSHARELSLYLSWLAEAHIYAGAIDEAASIAGRALELAAGSSSARSLARIRVLHDLLSPHRAVAAVAEFEDQLLGVQHPEA
jgi:transcriptional regulator with XRE-family HTH domain